MSDSEQVPVGGCCKQGNELCEFHKCLDNLRCLSVVWVKIPDTKELFGLEKRVNTHVEGIHLALSCKVQGFVRIMECCTILCLWSDRVNRRGQCIVNTY